MTNSMPMPDYSQDQSGGDPLDECQKDIEDLESRVSAIEQKLGIKSPADEQEPDALSSAIQDNSNPFLKATRG